MIRIWNEVVEDGVAFPQEEFLTELTAMFRIWAFLCTTFFVISLSLFCTSQLGASGARIACHFFVAGNNNFVVD